MSRKDSGLPKLFAIRGHCKQSITKLQQFIATEGFPNTSLEVLSLKKGRLQDVFEKYNETSISIKVLDETDEEDPFEIEDLYITLMSTLNTAISKINGPDQTQSSVGSRIKLPNVVIPIFSGDYTAYNEFINLFNSMIDRDTSLSPVQKLYYLKNFLQGEPLSLIANLPIDDSSYTNAIKILRERYDNKTKITQEHIYMLLDLPTMTRSTPVSIRNFISECKQQLSALKNLGEPVQHWDSILVCMLTRKLDLLTNRAYQLERDIKKKPTVIELLSFLERRALALENTETASQKSHRLASHVVAQHSQQPFTSATSSPVCIYCKLNHKLFMCPKFKLAPSNKRLEFAAQQKLCKICLAPHQRKCRFYFKCSHCKGPHNTLLHEENEEKVSAPTVTLLSGDSNAQVLLPTVRIKLLSQTGMEIHIRALLDSGSQASFVTQKVVDLLGITPSHHNTTIVGITNTEQSINKCINIEVHSMAYPFKIGVNCHVVQQITSKLPQTKYDMSKIKFPPNGKLADENFYLPGDVHMLLGAEIFFQILLPLTGSEQSSSDPAHPRWVNTSFGYVLAGGGSNSPKVAKQVISLFCQNCDNSISESLANLWKTDCVPEAYPEKLPEHEYCENLFKDTTILNNNNKFEVTIPLKLPLDQINHELGDSFHLALSRFLNLEKKLHRDPSLYDQYKKFIDEYISLGHGKYIDINTYDLTKDPVYFLPHHAVVKEENCTTKLRVVFDGSMRTSKKISLNDLMLNGPVDQKDLFDILIAFRADKYFFIGDIRMMFRKIDVNPQQRSLLNILWRDSPDQEIKCIQLQTVTYGLKSSSYLATRCLLELAIKYEHQFPLASVILKNYTFVDDTVVSCSSPEILEKMQSELIELLSLGGFQLHKWSSNCQSILDKVPKETHRLGEVDLQKENISVKALGVRFDIHTDTYQTACPEPYASKNDSKRDILSYISKFYDPLGLIGPIFVRAKVIMQLLWSANIDWDNTPPDNIREQWTEFVAGLSKMSTVQVPRCVHSNDSVTTQLVGFADASTVAYGCCLYLRCTDSEGNVSNNLLCSKSRVNPQNNKLTMPRLELNAALLLARLFTKVNAVLKLKFPIHDSYLFSDSQIVLAWLGTEIQRLNTYVANRVRVINELSDRCQWRYVNTQDNPSDCLSRGLHPHEIQSHTLWWHGPTFLQNKNCEFETQYETPEDLPEVKENIKELVCNMASTDNSLLESMKKFSDINKMTRILAYVKRFCNNCKKQSVRRQQNYLSTVELNDALLMLLKNEQSIYFQSEIKSLQNDGQVTGSLKPLHPFVDSDGIIRVGGRLQKASIPYQAKHPIILPKKSAVTELIIRCEHVKLLHAGQKIVLSSINQKYWIIDGLRTVKKVLHNCVICFRLKAAATSQLMGSLPANRVNVSRPFEKVGVDYAGPVSVKQSRVRRAVIGKGYIAVYVCFTTKAIHLELVSDLTTDAFLACFKRFISRRNLPSDVYSDNAKTFVSARNRLDDLYKLHASRAHQGQVQSFAAERGIRFHYIPAYSPVFGGLWEAAVKSTKYHLKRVVGKALLTYEQLNTVLSEIEAVLNSRPLTPMSADPTDFSYLTPGHFLTGAPLNAYPEKDVSDTPTNLLRFWSLCENMKQCFWKYWSRYYLTVLQSRPKWRNDRPNVSVGSLVILREDNTAPLHWPMARITRVFPGDDGKVRAVEVTTANGHTHRRSVTKICVLPINT